MRASLMGDIVRGLKGIPKFINDNRDQLFRIGAMALSGNWPGVVAESLGLL